MPAPALVVYSVVMPPLLRAFESTLNQAWSGSVLVGRWISFDEQMVKCVGRSAKFMMKHMPKKPIKNGECFVSRVARGLSVYIVRVVVRA